MSKNTICARGNRFLCKKSPCLPARRRSRDLRGAPGGGNGALGGSGDQHLLCLSPFHNRFPFAAAKGTACPLGLRLCYNGLSFALPAVRSASLLKTQARWPSIFRKNAEIALSLHALVRTEFLPRLPAPPALPGRERSPCLQYAWPAGCCG